MRLTLWMPRNRRFFMWLTVLPLPYQNLCFYLSSWSAIANPFLVWCPVVRLYSCDPLLKRRPVQPNFGLERSDRMFFQPRLCCHHDSGCIERQLPQQPCHFSNHVLLCSSRGDIQVLFQGYLLLSGGNADWLFQYSLAEGNDIGNTL